MEGYDQYHLCALTWLPLLSQMTVSATSQGMCSVEGETSSTRRTSSHFWWLSRCTSQSLSLSTTAISQHIFLICLLSLFPFVSFLFSSSQPTHDITAEHSQWAMIVMNGSKDTSVTKGFDPDDGVSSPGGQLWVSKCLIFIHAHLVSRRWPIPSKTGRQSTMTLKARCNVNKANTSTPNKRKTQACFGGEKLIWKNSGRPVGHKSREIQTNPKCSSVTVPGQGVILSAFFGINQISAESFYSDLYVCRKTDATKIL